MSRHLVLRVGAIRIQQRPRRLSFFSAIAWCILLSPLRGLAVGMPGVPHAYAWGYILSPLRGFGVAGTPGVPHAYAWGYVLSPLRGLPQRELRDSRAAMPSFPALPGNALPWRLRLLEPAPTAVRSSGCPVFRRRAVRDAHAWGCVLSPLRGFGVGVPVCTPCLRMGLRAVAASRLAPVEAPSFPGSAGERTALEALPP